uniref:Uncharacterized protein n=1 Tax=Pithovirus LCPAC403 TaxID=2506596 RepID=A0A481ZFE1_9VIRU|nr:MAG: hypothetical protein LCPAC403_03450 [Pithovirus LCPAC403]
MWSEEAIRIHCSHDELKFYIGELKENKPIEKMLDYVSENY